MSGHQLRDADKGDWRVSLKTVLKERRPLTMYRCEEYAMIERPTPQTRKLCYVRRIIGKRQSSGTLEKMARVMFQGPGLGPNKVFPDCPRTQGFSTPWYSGY
jgi:hypothetical protein